MDHVPSTEHQGGTFASHMYIASIPCFRNLFFQMLHSRFSLSTTIALCIGSQKLRISIMLHETGHIVLRNRLLRVCQYAFFSHPDSDQTTLQRFIVYSQVIIEWCKYQILSRFNRISDICFLHSFIVTVKGDFCFLFCFVYALETIHSRPLTSGFNI